MKMLVTFIIISIFSNHLNAEENQRGKDTDEPPEGYYAFIESPNAEPPRVRPPPYTFSGKNCREEIEKVPYNSPFNLCGDLNKGAIPKNPMGQNVLGSPYPFDLIKNMTLKYLSRTLPILKADQTLPKVAQLQDDGINENTISGYSQANDRIRRNINENENLEKKDDENKETNKNKDDGKNILEEDQKEILKLIGSKSRKSRKFCDQGGVFCMLYKAINGDSNSPSTSSSQMPIERRDEVPTKYEGPPTPCPAKVEYATPVFAKNYQGIWRYVVQIPYEGYFTQTVEVTRCLQSRCHYLDGGCLSSPRWSSLLVAEIYYPDTVLSSSDLGNPQRSPVSASQPPSVQDFQNYQQYLHKRAGLQAAPVDATTQKPMHCDGIDNLGCFQVRLFYDWFLIPGSCKCWRPDYFNKYVRRKNVSPDL